MTEPATPPVYKQKPRHWLIKVYAAWGTTPSYRDHRTLGVVAADAQDAIMAVIAAHPQITLADIRSVNDAGAVDVVTEDAEAMLLHRA